MSVPERYNMGVIGELLESRKVVLAVLLLVSGVGMLIIGVLAATTGLFTGLFGLSVYESWRLAGISAGLGMPLMIVGVFTVLPATKHQRLGAAVGLGLVVIGVVLFAQYFPTQWYGDPTDNTFLVVGVYFVGALLTITYLFLAVANLQTPTTRGHTRRPRRYGGQNPQTAVSLVKGVIGLALNAARDTSPSDEPSEVDLDDAADRLGEELAERIEESEVVDGHIVVTRSREMSHAQFTTELPGYVDLVDRDGRKYALAVDSMAFHLLD